MVVFRGYKSRKPEQGKRRKAARPLTADQRQKVEEFRKRLAEEARARAAGIVGAACIPEEVEIR